MTAPDGLHFYLRHSRFGIALCLLLTAPIAWPVAVGGKQTGVRQETLPTLEVGKTIERQLLGGEAHAFQITSLMVNACV